MATALTTVTNPRTAGAVTLGYGICWRVTSRILGVDLRHDEPWCRATLYRLDLEQPFYIALTVKAASFSGKWSFWLPARSRNRPSTALWGTCRCQGGNDDEQKDARFHGAEDFIDKLLFFEP